MNVLFRISCALVALYFLGPLPGRAYDLSSDRIEELVENIHQTGVTRDQIVSIGKPRYTSISNASLVLDNQDIVFVHVNPDEVYFFPREIMLWHQVVNDRIGGRQVSITHDPVTGSLVGFLGVVGQTKTTFGVFGPLLNNNLLLYDRASNSLWPQLFGIAIQGRLKGSKLAPFPLTWTTWGKAKKRYPDAKVLSRPTTGNYLYGRDPYGSYYRPDTYYQNRQIVYPLEFPVDKRLHPKEPVVGIRLGSDAMALAIRTLARVGVQNMRLGITPLVALYDEELDVVRVFRRMVDARKLTLVTSDNGFMDKETNTFWSADGKGLSGRLRDVQLERVPSWRAMWFAWSQFYQGTDLIAGEEELSVGDLLSQTP